MNVNERERERKKIIEKKIETLCTFIHGFSANYPSVSGLSMSRANIHLSSGLRLFIADKERERERERMRLDREEGMI